MRFSQRDRERTAETVPDDDRMVEMAGRQQGVQVTEDGGEQRPLRFGSAIESRERDEVERVSGEVRYQ